VTEEIFRKCRSIQFNIHVTENGDSDANVGRSAHLTQSANVVSGDAKSPTPGRLTLERIVETALRVIDDDGLEAVTMRRIADELRVQAPSLYNHVRSKEHLLDAVTASVMEQVDVSSFNQDSWRTALDGWAWSYYDALVAHPNLVPHLATAYGRLDVALARADQVYSGLLNYGWTPSRATRIAAGVRYAVWGAALSSFAGGFSARAAQFPNLQEIPRLRSTPGFDRAALKMLIDRFLDGLEQTAP
jgi:AcrR family transcriptional regulator